MHTKIKGIYSSIHHIAKRVIYISILAVVYGVQITMLGAVIFQFIFSQNGKL
jgi:hypothetical protein